MTEKHNQHLNKCPLSKSLEFRLEKNQRLDLIHREFDQGFHFLYTLKKEITFFGSARLPETSPYYQEARELARMLGDSGYTIITGGGPGIMEAANRGAYEAGADSVGLNIELPHEQRTNPYVKKAMGFHYFFSRKVMLSASAQAYVYFPGGFGTLDELLEIVTLIQTGKMKRVPVILMGKDFWTPFLTFIKTVLCNELAMIDTEDMNIYTLAESKEHALEIIRATQHREMF